MKKKLLKSILVITICIALSSLIEVFCFNFKTLHLNSTNKTRSISYQVIYSNENQTSKEPETISLKLNMDSSFINKLIINYDTKKDVPYSITYLRPSFYGNNSAEVFNDIFDNSFHASVVNINADVSDIIITYHQTDDLTINQIIIDNDFHFNPIRTAIIFLSLILSLSIFYFYKNGFKTDKLHLYFATISLILGSIIILAQPSATFYSFDDQIHFQHVVDIIGGQLNYSVGEFHLTEANVTDSAGHNSINSIEEQYAQNALYNSGSSNFSKNILNIAPTYDKFSYLPMAIGYHFAKLLNLPFVVCFLLGKFFNLLTYTILISYAIKIIKTGKRLLLVIALLPSNIFLASQYSYDPAVFSGITIFIAYLTNLFVDKKTRFDFKTAVIMLLALSYACFAKAIYAPLLLLTLFIPQTRFTNQKQARIVKTGLFIITLLLLAVFILPALSGEMTGDLRGGNTSVSEQLSLILSHPFDYAKILGDTTLGQLGFKFFSPSAIGDFAYINNPIINPSSNFFFIFLALILFVFLSDNNTNTLSLKQKSYILITNAVIIIFIWTALYLSYTPIGENTIFGVQARYFIPLLLPTLLCLQPKNLQNKINPRTYNTSITIIPTIITFICIIASIVIPYAN